MTEARHSSSIVEDGRTLYLGEPAGFVVRLEDGVSLYYAGDTALFGDMRLIGETHQPAIAFLPIGDRFTMGPEAAATACRWLGVRQVIPMHWGTFPVLTGTPARARGGAGLERRAGGDAGARRDRRMSGGSGLLDADRALQVRGGRLIVVVVGAGPRPCSGCWSAGSGRRR